MRAKFALQFGSQIPRTGEFTYLSIARWTGDAVQKRFDFSKMTPVTREIYAEAIPSLLMLIV